MGAKDTKIWFGAESMKTSLGSADRTYSAIRNYETGLRYHDRYGMMAGLMENGNAEEGFTLMETMIVAQVTEVLEKSLLSLSDPSVRFIISTTKGNVGLLEGNQDTPPSDAFLYESARKIAAHMQMAHPPVVISNACISGVSALIVARRMILAGECSHVVVTGCDVLNEFITSGFASFKSISADGVRPYDALRNGLNLGEACATVLLTSDINRASEPLIRLEGGAVTNDANHISGPSRTGDGLFYAIRDAISEAGIQPSDIGFVNTHGTATVYNDEMESKAITLAGLENTPLNSVKGYIGHTLGASGVVETLIAIEELRTRTVYGTLGFTELGVPCPVNISSVHRPLQTLRCLKTASGFGGCNAAVVIAAESCEDRYEAGKVAAEAVVTAEYTLDNIPGKSFAEQIREEYHQLGSPNMKFFKMSDLCKAAYVAAENLVISTDLKARYLPTEVAVILSNSSASLDTDMEHQRILQEHLPEGTSPAVFVYTLPSVAAGEICIRHKFQGDNTFFIDKDSVFAETYARLLIEKGYAKAAICGWCDKLGEHRKVNIKILEIKS